MFPAIPYGTSDICLTLSRKEAKQIDRNGSFAPYISVKRDGREFILRNIYSSNPVEVEKQPNKIQVGVNDQIYRKLMEQGVCTVKYNPFSSVVMVIHNFWA